MTHYLTYRRTPLHVTLWPDGTFRSAYIGPECDVTELLTDEQKREIESHLKEEKEIEE